MARYLTKIESALPQAEAFAYMADFAQCPRLGPERERGPAGRRGADRDRLRVRSRRALRRA